MVPLFSRKPRPSKDPTSLGNILLEAKLITEDQLERALAITGPLGENLVALGILDRTKVNAALHLQAVRRGDGVALALCERRDRLDIVLERSSKLHAIAETLVKKAKI